MRQTRGLFELVTMAIWYRSRNFGLVRLLVVEPQGIVLPRRCMHTTPPAFQIRRQAELNGKAYRIYIINLDYLHMT